MVANESGWQYSDVMSPCAGFASTGGELAMNNSSMWLEPQFESSQIEGEEHLAVDGCNYTVDGELMSVWSRSAFMVDGVKSSWWQISTATTMDVTSYLQSGLCFLAAMVVLGALAARNVLSIGVLAVIGGQEWLVTGLNLIFSVFFCFEQQQKQKHAWKQKSRLEKRKSRLSHCRAMQQMQVLIWISMMGNCWAMDVNVAQQITELAQAATRAAQAATTVAEKVGSKGMASGMESASKVLKNPDTFSGEDAASFMGWKLNFETWMTYGDERFGELLGKIEKMTNAPSFAAYDAEQKSMANKFFAILSSYLRGRTSALVRAVANGDKDGFRLWFDLCREYLPTSKQRTLSLAQTLAQYPQFTSKTSMLEQILNFEQLVSQYESSSGNMYPSDLKAATILRCSPQRIREYLQLSLKEESTYADIREAVLAHERVTKGFPTEQILKQVQTSGEHDTSAPMEVDRIFKGGKDHKGKGKKGDSKGKGRGAFSSGFPWSFGRGRGKGKQQKGKSKGKKGAGKKGHGKSKGKQKGAKNGPSDGCWICGDTRHWSKECPNRGRVNQVSWDGTGDDGYGDDWNFQQQQQQFGPSQQQQVNEQNPKVQRVQSQSRPPPPPREPSTPQQASSSSGSSTSYLGSAGSSSYGSTVRRIYDLELDLPMTSSSSSSNVRVVTSLPDDFFYDWLEGRLDLDRDLQLIDQSLEKSPRSDDDSVPLIVRVAQSLEEFSGGSESTFIILDSGSDVSLLPRSYIPDSSHGVSHRLKDCQGNALGVSGTKRAEIVVHDLDSTEAILRQEFLISDVTNCILSLGGLMKKGWNIKRTDDSDLLLVSPDGTLSIPTYYRGSSLAIDCQIRCIQEEPHHDLSELEDVTVRVVVNTRPEFLLTTYNDWLITADNTPYLLSRGREFAEVRMMWGHYWPYRSTLIKKVDSSGPWQVVELSEEYMYKDDSAGPILECDVDHDILTIMGVHAHGVEYFGVLCDESPAPMVPPDVDIPLIDAEVKPDDGGVVDVEQVPPVVEGDIEMQVEIPSKIHIEGLELSATSSVHDLRRICRFYGINQSGSKRKIYERIVKCHIIALRRQALDFAEKQYRDGILDPHEAAVPVRAPTLRERRLHELTHLPFQQWCPHCVACKSRPDHKQHSEPSEDASRENPTIQVDLMFGISGSPILIMVDVWTRFVKAIPMKTKSAKNIADSLLTFIGELGYLQAVEVAHDNEPVLNAGVEQTKYLRNKVGLRLLDQRSKNFHKGRTAIAERCIQTVRAQAKTIMHELQQRVEMKFEDKHILHDWSVMHSAWLLNRFHVHSSIKSTPYLQLHGRPYRGRVASFGSLCFGLDGKVDKHHPSWLAGLWLGKDAADHDILAVGNQKLVRCKAVRQTDKLWDKEKLVGLTIGPGDLLKLATHSQVKVLPAVPPMPIPVRDQEEGEEEATADEAASDPPSPEGVHEEMPGEAGGSVMQQDDDQDLPRFDEDFEQPRLKRSLEGGEGSAESKVAKAEPRVKHAASETKEKEEKKFPRIDFSSPIVPSASGSLQSSPVNAGNIRRVSTYGGVDVYIEDEDDSIVDQYAGDLLSWMENLEDETFEDEKNGPPDVDEMTLQSLDQAAAVEEIGRLREMNVIQDYFQNTGEELVLDTRQVYDWRYRDGQWRRRCRLVAREFRSGAQSTEETFSPTSSKYVVNIMLILCLVYQLSILVCDIKDAFLTVPQRELVIVEVPSWIKQEEGTPRFWKLCRCLPGQRKAALHWNEHFESVVQSMGFISFDAMPTVFRHGEKKVYLTIHVDDLLVIGSQFDCKWFLAELSQHFKLKSNGPFQCGQTAEVQYLKKNIIITPDGIAIEPCKQYIPKLLELLHIENRREKPLPNHANLETYHKDRILENECLTGDLVRQFRGGLGLCLYLAQDRPDVQEAVRVLSAYMGTPTVRALSALKHLACYLKGTMEFGVFLSNCDFGTKLEDHWCEKECSLEDPSSFTVECYCDSNWGGCKTTRRSTSSGMIFLNGSLVLSLCKSQSTVSLSSCEAELMAMTYMTAEAIMVCNVCKFLLGKTKREVDEFMDFIVYTDSSSAKALAQRRGVGRLKHVDLRHLWIQSCVRQKLLRLKKVGTVNNVADLNTKNLSAVRRKYLFGLCGLSENQKKKTSTNVTTVKHSFIEQSVARRIALLLAGLPMGEASSLHGVAEVISSWRWTMASALLSAVVIISVLGWMIPGSRSRSASVESSRARRRRYLDAEMGEVSDPDTWMALHHHSSSASEASGAQQGEQTRDGPGEGQARVGPAGEQTRDEPEGEPSGITTEEMGERFLHWDNRIFLIFNVIMQEKFTRWGRKVQPQFEWEESSYPTEASLKKSFFQLRLLAMSLDEGKLELVENICMMLEGVIDPADVRTELEHLEQGMVDNLEFKDSIKWLYTRYRGRCIGEEYDKIKWASEVYGSPEESMRVAQERALEAINDRIEMAYIRGDHDEMEELEELHRRVGLY